MSDPFLARAQRRVGTVLRGKYRLDRVLGVGGMAAVYAATHLRNGNRVAVKVLHRNLALQTGVRERFLREGYAANSVEHAGTIRILDDDTSEDGAIFLVMELLDGETLEARWQRSGRRLALPEVVGLLDQLLTILEAVHAKGIVHRDLKPENLFVTREGRLKLLDFGVARLRESASPSQTRTGAIFGTPAYMPPEQALGRVSEIDALSDLWSVGATAFTLLSGRYVREGNSAAEMLAQAVGAPVPELLTAAPLLPSAVARIVDRALATEKADRWPSARAMREALASAVAAYEHPDPDEQTTVVRVSQDDEATRVGVTQFADTLPGAPESETSTLPVPTVRRPPTAARPAAEAVAPTGEAAGPAEVARPGAEAVAPPRKSVWSERRRRRTIVAIVAGAVGLTVGIGVAAVVTSGAKQASASPSSRSPAATSAPRHAP